MVVGTAGDDEKDWWLGDKARVFISCGQATPDEKQLGREVRDRLRRAGFAPYLAVAVQSSASLTEGIYGHLRTAEYFLFIDFRRDRLGFSRDFRGSLFSNQELGIASFLGLDSLFYVERARIKREGILSVIQGNAISFARRDLVDAVTAGAREARWDRLPAENFE